MLNKVFIIGRLTKDAELKYTKGGTAVATMTVAVDRENEKKEVDFIPVVVWGKPAENVSKYLAKGSKCLVEGKIQIRNYEDKNGKKVYVTEIHTNAVTFLDSKKKEEPVTDQEASVTFDEDDIPF